MYRLCMKGRCPMNRLSITQVCGGTRVAQWDRSLDLTTHTSLSPIRRGFASSFVSYKKECTRLAAASDKVFQLLAQGRWFSPGTPASSTTKNCRHDITEILLKVALKRQKSNQINLFNQYFKNQSNNRYDNLENKFKNWLMRLHLRLTRDF
jgi:hypothetical protein